MIETKFKETEIGRIPEEWEVAHIADLAKNFTGLTYSPNDIRDYGTLVLRSSNIQNAKLSFDDNVYVDMPIPSRALVRKNDILVCVRNGSSRLIGKCAIIEDVKSDVAFGAFMTILRSKDNINPRFVLYVWQSSHLQRQIQDNLGATINQITNKDIDNFVVAIPSSLSEQSRIATALTSIDNLLSSLDKLIEKKKSIKQGAMQQLLTGKIRLKGFTEPWGETKFKETEIGRIPEEWETIKLSEIGVFSKGRGISRAEANSGLLPAIRYGEIYTLHDAYVKVFYSFVSQAVADCAKELNHGDLLFTASGETKEDIAKCVAYDLDFPKAYVGGDVILLTPTKIQINSRFFGFQLNNQESIKQRASMAQGDAVVHITSHSVSNIIVALPPLSEQSRIATALTSMDNEISALEQKRAKYEQIKQGMMQQLLTGKIRLI